MGLKTWGPKLRDRFTELPNAVIVMSECLSGNKLSQAHMKLEERITQMLNSHFYSKRHSDGKGPGESLALSPELSLAQGSNPDDLD